MPNEFSGSGGHVNGNYQVKDDQLLYFHKVKHLEERFNSVRVRHVPRGENTRADKLSKLGSGQEKGQLSSVIRQILEKPTIECFGVAMVEGKECWKNAIIQLIKEQYAGKNLRVDEVKKISRYCMIGENLY